VLVNYGGFLNAYSQGAALDLTDLMQQYGQDIIAMEGDYLKGGVIDGRQYALPIYAVYALNMGIIYRADVVEELGLQEQVAAGKTLVDWEPILAAVKEAKPDMTPFVTSSGATAPNFQYGTWDDLGNKYGVLMDGGLGGDFTVVDAYETPEYEAYAQRMYDWAQKGYIPADASTNTDSGATQIQSGYYLGGWSSTETDMQSNMTRDCGYPMTAINTIAPWCQTSMYQSSMWAIPVTCENPEKTFQFLNYLYADNALDNILTFGLEGSSYEIVEKGEKEGDDEERYHLLVDIWSSHRRRDVWRIQNHLP
jgi:putative aldouronate transport system substrate-binding protein